MRTNGFALFGGADGLVMAERAAARVQRYCKEAVVIPLSEIEGGQGNNDRAERWVLACDLGGERALPIVHGFLDHDSGTGEFALLSERDGVLVASRDRLGTRPLYLDITGTCVGSDHRFFAEPPRLLPNGAQIEVGSTKITSSPLAARECGLSFDECAVEVSKLLSESVARRVGGVKKVAVSFSGGLDSSLIALIAAKHAEVVLCSAFAPGSRDQGHAKAAADSLGLELIGVEMNEAMTAQELLALDLPFEPNPMDKALWCIYSTTAREAAAHGAEMMMLGQLADELFGGYMKYARAAAEGEERAAVMMFSDVLASGERAFIRDEEAVARFTEARFPFADEKLVEFALGVPVGYKIASGERKAVLRKAALMLGLPVELAAAPKKAAQYSSGVAKLVP